MSQVRVQMRPFGGIGNRLFMLAAAWHFASVTRSPVDLEWDANVSGPLLGGFDEGWLFKSRHRIQLPTDDGETDVVRRRMLERFLSMLRVFTPERPSSEMAIGTVRIGRLPGEEHVLKLSLEGYF